MHIHSTTIVTIYSFNSEYIVCNRCIYIYVCVCICVFISLACSRSLLLFMCMCMYLCKCLYPETFHTRSHGKNQNQVPLQKGKTKQNKAKQSVSVVEPFHEKLTKTDFMSINSGGTQPMKRLLLAKMIIKPNWMRKTHTHCINV